MSGGAPEVESTGIRAQLRKDPAQMRMNSGEMRKARASKQNNWIRFPCAPR